MFNYKNLLKILVTFFPIVRAFISDILQLFCETQKNITIAIFSVILIAFTLPNSNNIV